MELLVLERNRTYCDECALGFPDKAAVFGSGLEVLVAADGAIVLAQGLRRCDKRRASCGWHRHGGGVRGDGGSVWWWWFATW